MSFGVVMQQPVSIDAVVENRGDRAFAIFKRWINERMAMETPLDARAGERRPITSAGLEAAALNERDHCYEAALYAANLSAFLAAL